MYNIIRPFAHTVHMQGNNKTTAVSEGIEELLEALILHDTEPL